MLQAIFLFLFLPVSSAVTHSLRYSYTASSGISDFPEFISVGEVNGMNIGYYDSNSKKAVPERDWMKFDEDYWSSETQVAMEYQQTFKADLSILKKRFNQTEGVHVFQKRYGCHWDDETNATGGFEEFGYDGEDFMSLDLENQRWVSDVLQAFVTKERWNQNEKAFPYRRHYFQNVCIDWLKKYVEFGSSTLRRKDAPKVSLFQKGSTGNVMCHATGFYPERVMITWKRDGEEMQDDVYVEETLPNADGTFQKRVLLTVSPEERRKAQYTCEVAHSSGEPTVLVFHEDVEKANNLAIIIAVAVIVAVILLVVMMAAFVIMKKRGYTKAPQSDTSSDSSNDTPKA